MSRCWCVHDLLLVLGTGWCWCGWAHAQLPSHTCPSVWHTHYNWQAACPLAAVLQLHSNVADRGHPGPAPGRRRGASAGGGGAQKPAQLPLGNRAIKLKLWSGRPAGPAGAATGFPVLPNADRDRRGAGGASQTNLPLSRDSGDSGGWLGRPQTQLLGAISGG